MKKGILVLLLILSTVMHAQLKDCTDCDTISYTTKEIANNSLYDLQLLRNEIFARHQYIFKDERLLAYFQEFRWYQPDYNNPVQVILNPVENENIVLFKTAEARIKKQRQQLFSELKELQRALQQNDRITINLFMDDALPNGIHPDEAFKELDAIFSKIDLTDVNWYKDTAIYKVTIDNGFVVRDTTLHINGSEVTLSMGDIQHSKIMTAPFEYGSNYYSEDEYKTIWIFSFDGQKLRLVEYLIAG
ncbi:YARHG domain-containing protein [Aquimarina sp. M1]